MGISVPPYLVQSCPFDNTVPYRNLSRTQRGAQMGWLWGSCGALELWDILLRTDYSLEKRKVAPGSGDPQTVKIDRKGKKMQQREQRCTLPVSSLVSR